MTHIAPGGFIIYCPKCGDEIEVPGVRVQHVEASHGLLRVHIEPVLDITHTCRQKPDTDGLRPIERFIRHGALDDLGRNGA